MEAKELIEKALKTTGMDVDELAARLDYKSLRRARAGEIPLPESKRRHIADIVRLHLLEKGSATNLGSRTTEEAEEPLFSRRVPVNYGAASPREKLQAALRQKKMTPAALAKRIEYDAGIVENVVNGGGRISEAMAEKMVVVLDTGLLVSELLEGSDTPTILDATGFRGTHGSKATVQMPGGKTTRMVPLISWAAAGSLAGATALDEDFASDAVASTVPGRAFAVEISGDSMYPKIEPGDYVVVRADAAPRPGQVVLVRTIHGDVLCKRYTTRDSNRLVILSSINKSYEPIEIPASEIAWIYPVQQMIRNSNNL